MSRLIRRFGMSALRRRTPERFNIEMLQERVMAIDLTTLVSRRYPPGHPYRPMLRFAFEEWDPPQSSMPYTSMLDDVARNAEDMVETANREWAAGFPARARAGQSLAGRGVMGSRVSPLKMPEQMRGRVIAASI